VTAVDVNCGQRIEHVIDRGEHAARPTHRLTDSTEVQPDYIAFDGECRPDRVPHPAIGNAGIEKDRVPSLRMPWKDLDVGVVRCGLGAQERNAGWAARERALSLSNVIVVIGPGSIGQAIARRVSVGKYVLLADLRQENAEAAAEILSNAGFEVSTTIVDVSSRELVHALVQTATALGDVTGVIHAAGVSQPGIAGNDPLSRSLRHRIGARGVRQCHRPRRCRRRDRLAVRAPPRRADGRRRRGPRDDACR
jgi:short chain dehydrogenase